MTIIFSQNFDLYLFFDSINKRSHVAILFNQNQNISLVGLTNSNGQSITQHYPHYHWLFPLHTSNPDTVSSKAVVVATTWVWCLLMLPPATTGHSFWRHCHSDNHLDLLYPMVLTSMSFITLEKILFIVFLALLTACEQWDVVCVPLFTWVSSGRLGQTLCLA